jgi:hypothetical protein
VKQHFGIASMALVSILSTFGSSAAPAAPVRSLDRINPRLAALGLPYRLARVEWITDSGKLGQVILFNDRGNGQFPSHWVPFDPDRSGLADIFTIIDGADGATSSGLTEAETTAAIERAFQSWEDVQCSTIPITNLGSVPIDLGVVQALTGLGGTLAVLADITHAGFVPQAFFDLFFPVSDVVIAATFTFDFLGGSGNPTDINNDGKADTAFRETYYNDARDWAIDDDLDVETAALHETGHGLSQAHFGRLTYVESNGTFHFSPRAVMNAGYTGIQQLTGHDVANHCSIWSSWPIK